MTGASTSSSLLRSWQRCRTLPAGGWLFARLLARMVPYSGSIRPRIDELSSGYAKVRMADRRRLRNHFDSIHAIALANLGELATGLAMTSAMPPGGRGIPVCLRIEFLKKARGEIVAEARCTPPDVSQQGEHEVQALLVDADGDKVARFTARWAVGPTG